MRTTSERLSASLENIINIWEERSRAEVPAAADKTSVTVRNELSRFLKALVLALSEKPTRDLDEEGRSATLHGQQRSGTKDYTLPQILKEYALLREVLFAELLKTGPLTESERVVINDSVDRALQFAADEFAQAEQATIKLALAKAEQSNRDLEHFAAIVAHDFRSPLATISGFAELLQDEFGRGASREANEYLSVIRRSVERLAKLVHDILAYSTLISTSDEFSEMNSEEAVLAAIQNLKDPLTESSGHIEFKDLPKIVGSLPLLSQLFQNLFANSIKFRSDKPLKISVRAEDRGDVWEFAVIDNGIGFDSKTSGDIFGLYKRLHKQSGYQGSGIGLATCRRVIELHGGGIRAESQPGEGAKFYFTLPKAGAP